MPHPVRAACIREALASSRRSDIRMEILGRRPIGVAFFDVTDARCVAIEYRNLCVAPQKDAAALGQRDRARHCPEPSQLCDAAIWPELTRILPCEGNSETKSLTSGLKIRWSHSSAEHNLEFDSAAGAEDAYARLSANIGILHSMGVTAGVTIRFRVLEQRGIINLGRASIPSRPI